VLPFGLGNYLARDFGLLPPDTDGSVGLRTVVGVMYVVIRLSCLVAAVGLFTPRVWRHPHAHFLVGAVVGGVGAMAVLDSSTRNQVYFLLVTPVFVAAATAWGLVELLRRVARPVAIRVCTGALVAGAVLSVVLMRWRPPGFDQTGRLTLPWFMAQLLVVIGILVVLGVALVLVARRRPAWRHTAPLACAGLAIGLGLLTGPQNALHTDLYAKAASARQAAPPRTQIGPGGLSAAAWLSHHSSPDAVVATNSHCMFPAPRECDHRAFWISGYTERQILLEGWSYTSRSAALAAKQGTSVPLVAFWKPDLLRQNDEAFSAPTRRGLDRLRRQHHVTWLFVDKRFPVDLARLRRLADLRYSNPDYAVFRLR